MSPPDARAPIGVFDSGVGGLTVVRALRTALPAERLVYLGDTARLPYGTKSAETVVRYARRCAEFLLARGAKALVIACNTASAYALETLEREVAVPVVGVVRPGAHAAARLSRARRIGVLGTHGTIASGAYTRALHDIDPAIQVVGQACPLLVPLAEEGWLRGPVPELVANEYLRTFAPGAPGDGADVLVLGCTHYPLLRPLLQEVATRLAGRPLALVDSAAAVGEAVRQTLFKGGLLAPGSAAGAGAGADAGAHEFFLTDTSTRFRELAGTFLGEAVAEVAQVDVGA